MFFVSDKFSQAVGLDPAEERLTWLGAFLSLQQLMVAYISCRNY
jgi:hypothetical protein